MADEPRRSGRATKGQHTKDQEEDEAGPKQKGKTKGKKTKAEPETEEQDEPEDIIRCVCGFYEEEEDEPRAMICCDKCQAWQHNDCMGLPTDYEPPKYFCERCKPADHKELLKAVQRGEKPWEERALAREEARHEKSKKKGKKGGRKSAARASEATRTPTLEPEESVSKKRKAEEPPASDTDGKSKKARGSLRESTSAAEIPETPEPEPEPEKQETADKDTILAGVATDVKEIDDPARSKIASNIIKSFIEQANSLAQAKAISLTKGESAKNLGTVVALQVEHAVYQIRSGGEGEPNESYKSHMRTILNNIKSNPTLAMRLMSKQLRADELAAMSAADMATDEQKKKDADEKLRMEKQHVLVEEQGQGPRIRRTHKGDEYVDGSGQPAESITNNAPRKQAIIDQDIEMKSPIQATSSEKPSTMRKPSASTKGRPFGDSRRKSSSNFDLDKIYSGVQGSPTDGEAPKFADAPQHGSPGPALNAADADPDVDRLLKDEDNESEPYSPKDFVEEGVVWRGRVNGGSLGTFNTIARFAAGCQPDVENLRMSWSDIIPPEIRLHGRIQPQKADDYLCGLEYSNTTELVIISVAEPKDSNERKQFTRFFEYLKQKERYGVGSQHQVPAIKDIYLLPMEIGQALPTVMKALEHNFVDPVTERSFLVPIVIKWTELPHNAERARQMQIQQQQQQQQATQSPSLGPPVPQTPLTPHEPQMMQFEPTAQPFTQQPVNGGGQGAYSTPPNAHHQPQSQTHAPVHHPNQPQSAAAVNALRVLGPDMAASPAVLDLIAQAPTAGENEFNIIKECIEENVEAGRNLGVLTRMLQEKYQTQRNTREQAGAGGGAAAAAVVAGP